ncbi:TetR/AcrR family transcriptional regulator [Streptomyces megasporus]|uniref:TetR/AcrR family transcriptional regulator n=1 Tax=Streptomyces megasporus TaxID=44060 RepID=UPI00068DCC9F|nr:TetR/AcrR family transcriptional regulator [Streptomyces megasporus]
MSRTPVRRGSAAADRAEPRAVRTRERVVRALLDALAETPLEELSVADLCRRAGVHRVTFYGHWPDIRTLAADVFAEAVDRLAGVSDEAIAAARTPVDLAAVYLVALRRQLRELLDRRDTYRVLFSSDVDAGFHRRLTEALRERAEAAIAHLARLGVDVPARASGYPALFVAGGVVTAFHAWAVGEETDVEAAAVGIAAQLPGWWPRAHTPVNPRAVPAPASDAPRRPPVPGGETSR